MSKLEEIRERWAPDPKPSKWAPYQNAPSDIAWLLAKVDQLQSGDPCAGSTGFVARGVPGAGPGHFALDAPAYKLLTDRFASDSLCGCGSGRPWIECPCCSGRDDTSGDGA